MRGSDIRGEGVGGVRGGTEESKVSQREKEAL